MGRHVNAAGVQFSVDDSKDDRYTEAGGFTSPDSAPAKKAPAKKSAAKKSTSK